MDTSNLTNDETIFGKSIEVLTWLYNIIIIPFIWICKCFINFLGRYYILLLLSAITR